MPKLSGDTLLQRAIPRAVDDRLSFIDALGEDSAEVARVKDSIRALRSLPGIAMTAMDEAKKRTAFAAFVWAEQWHDGVAHAHHYKGRVARNALRELRLLRTYRHANLGLTTLEAATREMVPVEIRKAHKLALSGAATYVGPGRVN